MVMVDLEVERWCEKEVKLSKGKELRDLYWKRVKIRVS